MPELRHDPIQQRWVIIASERATRPMEYVVDVTHQPQEFCPFCPCNEQKTPPEILSLRDGYGAPNSPGWSVRVVANKYPALRVEGELDRAGEGLYDRINGIGAHEIVIESPDHQMHMADQPVSHIAKVLRAYRERVLDLMRDVRFLYVVVFRNYGESAGASLAHPHSQIMTMPILPRTIEIELRSARDHYQRRERCLFCDIIRQEMNAGSRMVIENKDYVVFAPYASRSPFELFLAPRKHQHTFTTSTDQEFDSLAKTLSETLKRLRAALNDPPYNFVLHMAPNMASKSIWFQEFSTIAEGYHWHLEIIPRLTKPAGFEWGTGFHINPTPPEEAAGYLRQVKLEA
jgi:UDPglucose--hexose-1-phosphate uridylyltransferase